MVVGDQDAVRAFLEVLLAARHGTQPEIRETHISTILLAGDEAFKLKRPIKTPYLDFSTPQLRLEACEAEVALNRRTAPGIYREARRITREGDGELTLDGAGELVDAVVTMARFDEDTLFDRLAETGQLDLPLLDALADESARFHDQAQIHPTGDGADRIRAVIAMNARSFAELGVFSQERIAALGKALDTACTQHAALLDSRARRGRIRRCHGDLHLRNICLFDGHPRVFDCIEFNADLAEIDTFYDLAFLLMDLWHRGRVREAGHVANRYVDRTGDEDGFALLPFFMALRAAIRALVAGTQIAEGGGTPALEKTAQDYLALAFRLLEPTPARMIAIGGLSGTGKTTVAEALAPSLGAAPGARILESDRLRKALYGVSPETRLGPEAYAPQVSRHVYETMRVRAEIILAGGSTALVEAVFLDEGERAALEALAQRLGIPFCGIWLEAGEAALRERVASRRGGASDAGLDVLAGQVARDTGTISWHRIAADQPVENICAEILQRCATSGTDS
ncbi:MAG: bifunctional aminoglycoside phosphotransferase/ATP-binding protein [Salinarimonas sp.]